MGSMTQESLTAALMSTNPVYCDRVNRLALSLEGTWVGTVYLQKCIKNNGVSDWPAAGDAGWNTVAQYTVPMEDQVAFGDCAWYRWYFAARTSGTVVATRGLA